MAAEQLSLKHGLYAGSFDPPTTGHLWVIERGANLFDELHVAVAVNPDKKTSFTPSERVEMLEDMTKDLGNVTVSEFENIYTVRYAEELGCGFMLRGLRNARDLDDEQTLVSMNRNIAPEIETLFLSGPDDLLRVSSSAIKSMIGPEGWENEVQPYVSNLVLNALEQHFTTKK